MTGSGQDPRWWALRLRVPAELEEPLVGALAAWARGFEVRSAAAGRCELDVHLRSAGAGARAREVAERLLREAGADPAGCVRSLGPVEDGRWVERYQASLRPFPVGRRFTVHPAGRIAVDDGREPLLLVPGRAFGTGEHATTQLCVEQLERRVAPGSAWLDLGCGNGILALVARRCGAARVCAVDRDPEALGVAAETLRANGVERGVELCLGSLERIGGTRWDGVACNIAAPFFLERAAELAGLLRPGAPLLATGFPGDEAGAVGAALAAAGLHPVARRDRAPWALLVVTKA